jgi:hypothetical protein
MKTIALRPAALALCISLAGAAACGGAAPDPRYPAREDGCPVRTYPGPPAIPVDDLGTVRVECRSAGGGGGSGGCERRLLDAVCRRGGDVAWGMADNALTSAALFAHAAHSKRATQGPRERGCAVQVFRDAPPMKTENLGSVTAFCAEDDSRETCLRELEDQVCLLGGDVLWQIDGPTPEATSNGAGQRMHGRAAHTR